MLFHFRQIHKHGTEKGEGWNQENEEEEKMKILPSTTSLNFTYFDKYTN
jgi:hypothetical protein